MTHAQASAAATALADMLERAADDAVADESVMLAACCILTGRRYARLANTVEAAQAAAGAAAGLIGIVVGVEFHKLRAGA